MGSLSSRFSCVLPTREQGNYSFLILFVIIIFPITFSQSALFIVWWSSLKGHHVSLCWGTRELRCAEVVLSSCERLWVWGCTGCWPGAPVPCWSTGWFYSSLLPAAPADTNMHIIWGGWLQCYAVDLPADRRRMGTRLGGVVVDLTPSGYHYKK